MGTLNAANAASSRRGPRSDREETVEAGNTFDWPPAHAPEAEAGTQLIQLSPTDQLSVEAAPAKAMHGG